MSKVFAFPATPEWTKIRSPAKTAVAGFFGKQFLRLIRKFNMRWNLHHRFHDAARPEEACLRTNTQSGLIRRIPGGNALTRIPDRKLSGDTTTPQSDNCRGHTVYRRLGPNANFPPVLQGGQTAPA